MKNLHDVRRDFSYARLDLEDLNTNPFEQFEAWFDQANEAQVFDPTAMALATANKDGRPACRIVLLKQFDERGFVWFTDYQSQKGQDLAENPFAALTFYWSELDRQVRLSGRVEKIDRQESEDYFNSRPVDSRISASVSMQSEVIENREKLLEKGQALRESLSEKGIPMPDRWGGYRLIPNEFEFWQGRPNRLHDRFVYTPANEQQWNIARLSP